MKSKLRGNYLANCDSCEWTKLCVKAASARNCQRAADRHARREPGHETTVTNLQQLSTVTKYRYVAIGQVDAPPF